MERGGKAGAERERESAQPATVQLDAPLRQLMAKGRPSVADVVEILKKYPMQRIAMMETLQRELGNAFVQQVTAELQPRDRADASFMQVGVTKPLVPTLALSKDAGLDGVIANASMFQGVAEQQLAQLTGVLPGYLKARNALDHGGVQQIGMVVLASLELLRAAVSGMGDQLGKHDGSPALQCSAGGDLQAELALAQKQAQLEALQEKRKQLALAATNIQHHTLATMTPREYRGVLVSDMLPAVADVGADGEIDVRAQVGEELGRTLRVIITAERLFTQFAQPGALQDSTRTWQARQEIGELAHRPADLAFLRSVLSGAGLWQALNKDDGPDALGGLPRKQARSPFEIEVCTDDGPLTSLWAETKKQADETGWLNDIGNFDRHLASLEIRIGSTEGVLIVYQQIMSASEDGRAQILYALQRKGQLEPFLDKLPWKYTKDIHDGLPQGHGDIKSALQRHFLVEGKWGTSLEHQEYHAPSLTKLIRDAGDSVGGIGEDIIDGFDSALNFVTFGFHHSYGEARDLHSQGLITDDDYATALRQISTRTAVGMAIMMATAGYGRAAAVGSGGSPAMMGAMNLNRGVAGTTLAAGVEGATFATAEMFALDTTDMVTGAKKEYSDVTDYLKVAMLGGGMGAMVGGTTSWLSSRTAARYLPSEMRTKGQTLAIDHPSLAPVLDQLQGVGRGTTVELRITASQADDLAGAGVIDPASHKALRDALGNNAEVNAVIEVIDDLDMPMSATSTGGQGGAGSGGKPPAPSPSLTIKSVGPAKTITATGTAAPVVTPQTLVAGLPKGAVIERTGGPGNDGWVLYRDAGGQQRVRFRAVHAKTLREAAPGRNYSKDATAAINDNGEAFVMEGRHRAIGAAKGDNITPDKGGVPGQAGVLDYEYVPVQVSEEGLYVRDLKIDYSEPDVSLAEADFMRAQKYRRNP